MPLQRYRLAFLLSALLLAGAASARRSPVIAALGDSITAGTPYFLPALETGGEGEGDPEGQYLYWAQRGHPDWRAINLGIRGQRSDEIRARFDEALRTHRPDYLVIQAGSNDIFQEYPLNELGANLKWMYQQAKQQNILPIAATLPPCDPCTAAQTAQIREANRWIRDAAEKLRIPLLDFHALLADPTLPDRHSGTPDGIHPDIGGHRKAGRALANIIEQLETARPL